MNSIFYLCRVSLLSGRTSVHNIAKTCESLSGLKEMKMTLVTTCPALNREQHKDFLKEHNIKQGFPVVALNSWSRRLEGSRLRPLNWLEVILANFSLCRFLLVRKKKIDIVYLRDQHLFLAALFSKYFLRKPVFFEAHAAQRKKHTQFLLNLMVRISRGVVAISWSLKNYYQGLNKNIVVAFCLAPEIESFPHHKSKEELRRELNLPLDKVIIGYAGRLDLQGCHSNYDIDKVLKALQFLPENVLLVVIGAREKEAKLLEGSGIRVYPRLPRLRTLSYLLAFDILVIPKLGEAPGDSPAKMFEYLAAKRPLVAAKTGPVSEVLKNEENALLVFPNTPEQWAKTIQRVINDQELSQRISQQGFEDSQKYTWQKRAQKIWKFIEITREKSRNEIISTEKRNLKIYGKF